MTCFHCGDKTETYPWKFMGMEVELCEHCHPKCEEPGCEQLMMRGGEYGCCELHERQAA